MLEQAMAAPVQPDTDPLTLTVRVGERGTEQASAALAQLAAAGIVVNDFSLGQPSLDEVFMALTDTKGVAA